MLLNLILFIISNIIYWQELEILLNFQIIKNLHNKIAWIEIKYS